MGKTIIHVSCIDQRLAVVSSPVIASGGKNEDEITFDFCPLWADFEKTAVFYRNKDTVYHIPVVDDKCIIPHEVLASEGAMYFGVFGVSGERRRTSEVLKYRVTKGAITEGGLPSDPTADVYARYLDSLAKMEQAVEDSVTIIAKAGEATARANAAADEFNEMTEKAVSILDYRDIGTIGPQAIPATLRLINKTPIPAGVKINDITAYFRYASGADANVSVDLWKLADGVMTCVHSVKTTVKTDTTHYETIPVGYVTAEDTYVSIFADKQTLAYTSTGNTGESWRFNDVTSDVLDMASASSSEWMNVICIDGVGRVDFVEMEKQIIELNVKIDGILNDILVIGKGGDFSNIQDALDYLALNNLDTATHHWTLLIMPGVYPRFSTYHAKWGAYSTRYVSLVGLDKTQCIIRDDSGEYNTPPAEIRTNGLIKDLQFVATHDNPPAVSDRENAKHKSYAVHMDHGTQVLTVEDCIFTSYHAPAIGMGVWKDSDIKFRNCDFNSLGDAYNEGTNDYQTNYTYLTNHGAFFAHANMLSGGSAKLTLDNCRAYSKAGNRVFWLEKSAQWSEGNTVMTVECTHNIAWSDADGVGNKSVVASELTKAGASFGNNSTELNA